MERKRGMGWIPDYPDIRDYTEKTEEVKSVFGSTGPVRKSLPASADLREWCSPVEDQGGLGSCTYGSVRRVDKKIRRWNDRY